MPKRAATPTGRPPKRLATTTQGGKPRCDRCRKPVFENQISDDVNGRSRHRSCWPALVQADAVRRAAWWDTCGGSDPAHTRMERYKQILENFQDEGERLIEKEFVMKAVNCVSKGVREALLRTNEVGLALSAMSKRAATPAGRVPKRAALALGTTTPGGKPRCDRCRKAVFENQIQEDVNGHVRHRSCWPEIVKLHTELSLDIRRAVMAYLSTDAYMQTLVNNFVGKKIQLIEKEFLMKAVNCVSKGVREALLRTNEVGLALSGAQ
jgi:hypothetical protein